MKIKAVIFSLLIIAIAYFYNNAGVDCGENKTIKTSHGDICLSGNLDEKEAKIIVNDVAAVTSDLYLKLKLTIKTKLKY